MDENTKKIIQDKFDALPESIKEMIMSAHYEDTLIQIGGNNNLTVSQMGILERETTLVMMGLTDPKDFEIDITRELGVDNTKGNQIVTEINEKIFLKIRTLLKLMNTPIGEEPDIEDSEQAEINKEIKQKSTTSDPEAIFRNAGIEVVEKEGAVQNLKTPELMAPKENIEIEAHKDNQDSYKVESYKVHKEETATPIKESAGSKHDSIIMQKLSGTVQMPKIDPYRMPIE